MNHRHIVKMAQWARNPPSLQRVILVFSVVGICLALAGIEFFIGWPEGLSPDASGHPRGVKLVSP